jgi:hypothetical protein
MMFIFFFLVIDDQRLFKLRLGIKVVDWGLRVNATGWWGGT